MFKFFSKVNDSIELEYINSLPSTILAPYKFVMPFIALVLVFFTITDIYVRELYGLFYTRIIPLVLAIVLVVFSFSKFKNRLAIIIINNLFTISLYLMAIVIFIIVYDTDLRNISLNVIIMISVAMFFFVKGKKSILFVYSTTLIITFFLILFYANIQNGEYFNLVNPLVIYIGSFITSIITEKIRYKEFFYKNKLNDEKEKTKELYYETLVQNVELHSQKEEVKAINDELHSKSIQLEINLELISELNEKLKKRNKDVTDSINYASKIQQELLPNNSFIDSFFSAYSLLFKPFGIVSGDFYYLKQCQNKKIIVVADCTGHGVPGALMSVLSISFLNEITSLCPLLNPNEMLALLNKKVRNTFSQKEYGSLDGLDIGICIIDNDTSELHYAGARHPLCILKNGKLIELLPHKVSIGMAQDSDFNYQTQSYKIEGNETFYMFSDGFQDQFGGANKKKYISTRFKKFLLSIQQYSLKKQQELLEQEFIVWKGRGEQVDDVLVLGFKI